MLSQSQKGDLLDAIFAFNDDESIDLEPVTNMAFSFIKSDLIRNKESWLRTKEERSRSGKLGNLSKWHKDLYDQVVLGKITFEEAENIAKHRKTSHSDNSESLKSQEIANIADNVNDNVNDNDNDNVISKEIIKKLEKKEIQIPDFVDAELWNEFLSNRKKSKKAVNSDLAVKKLVNKINKFYDKGLNVNEILESSVISGWNDIYEPKTRNNNSTKKYGCDF